jgi:hypothetical protein
VTTGSTTGKTGGGAEDGGSASPGVDAGGGGSLGVGGVTTGSTVGKTGGGAEGGGSASTDVDAGGGGSLGIGGVTMGSTVDPRNQWGYVSACRTVRMRQKSEKSEGLTSTRGWHQYLAVSYANQTDRRRSC